MKRAAALLALALAGCTAHAPARGSASAVETSVERLSCEEGRAEAQGRSVEVHPEFTLAFVEFDDQGRFWDRRQLELLEQTLDAEEARSGGLIVGVFAHGWHHDGSLCDQNVACFRTFLTQIAHDTQAITRASGGRVTSRRVVGIFVGWRGRSGTLHPFSDLTFWARKRVAHKIGSGDLIELLTRVDLAVKRMNAVPHDTAEIASAKAPATRSADRLVDGNRARLVIIGHSFGGTMVYDALANILKSRVVEALVRERERPGQAVIEGFGDLVVLVNPAFEAARYRSLYELSHSFRRFAPRQGPVLVIIASETDGPNQTWFPLGRLIETAWERTAHPDDKRALRTSVGNYDDFVDYRLEAAVEDAGRRRLGGGDLRGVARRRTEHSSRCACELALEDVGEEELPEVARRVAALEDPAADAHLPARACGAPMRYGRAELTCSPSTDLRNPFWVVRASDDVVHGHSGFFTNAYVDFVRGVVLEAVSQKRLPEAG